LREDDTRYRLSMNLRRVAVQVAGSAAAVAAATGLVYALRPIAPTLSLGVLYVLAVLPVAVAWGVRWSLPVAVASMLTFNFFFLPPQHTLQLADSTNWGALAAYSGTAVVVSELAARARRRAADAEQREHEASLLAEIAGHLLAGRELDEQVGWIGEQTAEVLGVPEVTISLEQAPTISMPPETDPPEAVRRRFLPALSALLAVAVDRRRLEREALEAETLRVSDLAKTALLRAVSHDLRSPLTGITTAVGALRNDDLVFSEDDRRELLETIAVDAARLGRLVADLLDLSRLEAEGARPERAVWALDELVRTAVEGLVGRERIDVDGASSLVDVDAVQIERVLVNLLENALKFSPGAARVRVRISATPDEASVRISDDGPGVPEVELERVFEPFYRAGPGQGAGLGLAIARGFAAANGGRLWAESQPGQGATFVLALPAARVPAELTS
jgi:two-component system sensor histidine kinase KdpD